MSDTSDPHRHHPPFVVLYAVGIHEARNSGDRTRMQQMIETAERYLAAEDEVRAALQELRTQLGSGA